MNYEIIDCIDAGTEFCPCHLAETGDCILCSQLSGKCFCDCVNWKGTCIYQEYVWNGSKAKEGRKTYSCKIIDKKILFKDVILLTILLPHSIVQKLLAPGSFVFLRNPNCDELYNSPISIMEANVVKNTITVAIEIKGIKTKRIDEINIGEDILVKAPFWNGVFGLKHVYKAKEATSIIIARGIGQAPMVPVMKKLYSRGNKILVVLDKANFGDNFIEEYLQLCNAEVILCNSFANGEITDDLKGIINSKLESEDINLIHVSAADILIYKVIEFLNGKKTITCCNNAKMCCGEGVCGACTARFKGHRVKRLCKLQTDPEFIFEGRRFI